MVIIFDEDYIEMSIDLGSVSSARVAIDRPTAHQGREGLGRPPNPRSPGGWHGIRRDIYSDHRK